MLGLQLIYVSKRGSSGHKTHKVPWLSSYKTTFILIVVKDHLPWETTKTQRLYFVYVFYAGFTLSKLLMLLVLCVAKLLPYTELWDPFCWHGLTKIRMGISIDRHSFIWDVVIQPCPAFDWIKGMDKYLNSLFMWDVIIHPCLPLTEIRAIYKYHFIWDVINYPCPTFNCGLAKFDLC